jgi:hypothetical protein
MAPGSPRPHEPEQNPVLGSQFVKVRDARRASRSNSSNTHALAQVLKDTSAPLVWQAEHKEHYIKYSGFDQARAGGARTQLSDNVPRRRQDGAAAQHTVYYPTVRSVAVSAALRADNQPAEPAAAPHATSIGRRACSSPTGTRCARRVRVASNRTVAGAQAGLSIWELGQGMNMLWDAL